MATGATAAVCNPVVVKRELQDSSYFVLTEDPGNTEEVTTSTYTEVTADASHSICLKDESDGTNSTALTGNHEHVNETVKATCTGTAADANSSASMKQNTQCISLVVLPLSSCSTEEGSTSDYADTALNRQKLYLLRALEESPELSDNRVKQPGSTIQQKHQKWQEIAKNLNAMGPVQRTATSWKQYWKDWRNRVRGRARAAVVKMKGTGGASSSAPADSCGVGGEQGRHDMTFDAASHLNGVDCRVMALVGWDTVSGVAGAVEVLPSGSAAETLDALEVPDSSASLSPTAAAEIPVEGVTHSPCPDAVLPSSPAPASDADVVHSAPTAAKSQVGPVRNFEVRRRRRRQVPPSIANQLLNHQKQLVEEVKLLRQALVPMADYFKLLLEREKGKDARH